LKGTKKTEVEHALLNTKGIVSFVIDEEKNEAVVRTLTELSAVTNVFRGCEVTATTLQGWSKRAFSFFF
jgi:hypothetical protein